jgi:hypothetical protein
MNMKKIPQPTDQIRKFNYHSGFAGTVIRLCAEHILILKQILLKSNSIAEDQSFILK